MRCVKFERTNSKPSPVSSPADKTSSLPTSTSPAANLLPSSSPRTLPTPSSLTKTIASTPQDQSLQLASALRNKLIAPISAVSVETTPIKIKPITRGQSTKSQDTKIDHDMPSKKSEAKPGGRHPHPPNGNNKKLKHVCPFDGCLWRFATPYKLRRHIKSHTKETPYLCEECGRGFSVRYNLLMHIQTIHSQPQRYKCPVRGCKEAFHSQPRLNGHLRRVHKKDVKTMERPNDRCDSRGNSTSSVDSVTEEELTTARNTRQRRKFVCSECRNEFTTQAKLTLHMRTHTTEEKSSEQSIESPKDRISKHLDSHKNGRQFACPHENCNRVFLHQSHLKNHLKMHTTDHQFSCPVLDCSQQFSSEAEYNHHLHSHINLGYKCSHPGCELSFLSKKRLTFHIQAVHCHQGFYDGTHSSFLEGIRPHLGVNHQSAHLLSPHSCVSPIFSFSQLPQDSTPQPIKSEPVSYDFIKDIDLPSHAQKHFETVLSHNKHWSGQQIDQFLHSAVDLSEIEARLSCTEYESDSGYSTYDVSPIAAHPPLTLAHPQQSLMGPPLHPAAGPMFNHGCNFSPTNTVFPDGLYSAASSPCSTEVGFFSPHAELESMANTPNQAASFFPGEMVPHGVQMYPHHPNAFGAPYFMEEQHAHASMQGYLNSRVPDILVHSASHLETKGPTFTGCRRNSDSQVNFGEDASQVSRSQLVTQSLPNMGRLSHIVKSEYGEACALSANSHTHLKTEEGEKRYPCSMMEHQSQISHTPLASSHPSSKGVSSSRATSMKGTKKGKSSKSGQKRKNQWPRSMNQANMMAFRQHILNKLKKGQENTTESYAIKQEASSPKPMAETELSLGGSESDEYEVQVKVQRNHSSDSRSQSAPIEGSSPASLPMLHTSQSDSNVNKEGGSSDEVCPADTTHLTDLFTDDMFNSMNFNPDCLLTGADEEQMLKTLGFDESDDEIATLLGVGSDSLIGSGSGSSDVMDLDCIQDLLNEDTVPSPILPVLPQTSLHSTIFGTDPSSPPVSSPLNQDSPLSSYHSSHSEYTIPVESLVSMDDSNVSLNCRSSACHSVTGLYGTCQEFGSCAPEMFDM